jgi:mannose-6-phosphate isomerase-like protein (cupin superfamily)
MQGTIHLEATGERVTFLADEEEEPGARLLMEVSLPPEGEGPPPHVHHRQVETFEVLEGRLGVRIGDLLSELEVGDRATVPADTVHTFWNAGDGALRFSAEIRPALNMEWMLREIFASCNRRGASDPSPWEGAQVLTSIKGEYSLADVPLPVQRYLFPVVAALGNALGLSQVRQP